MGLKELRGKIYYFLKNRYLTYLLVMILIYCIIGMLFILAVPFLFSVGTLEESIEQFTFQDFSYSHWESHIKGKL